MVLEKVVDRFLTFCEVVINMMVKKVEMDWFETTAQLLNLPWLGFERV